MRYTKDAFRLYVSGDAVISLLLESKRSGRYLIVGRDVAGSQIIAIAAQFYGYGLTDDWFAEPDWKAGDFRTGCAWSLEADAYIDSLQKWTPPNKPPRDYSPP